MPRCKAIILNKVHHWSTYYNYYKCKLLQILTNFRSGTDRLNVHSWLLTNESASENNKTVLMFFCLNYTRMRGEKKKKIKGCNRWKYMKKFKGRSKSFSKYFSVATSLHLWLLFDLSSYIHYTYGAQKQTDKHWTGFHRGKEGPQKYEHEPEKLDSSSDEMTK